MCQRGGLRSLRNGNTGITGKVTNTVSSALLANTHAHVDALGACQSGNPEAITEMFAESAFSATEHGRQPAASIRGVQEAIYAALPGRPGENLRSTVDLQVREPARTAEMRIEITGKSSSFTYPNIAVLVEFDEFALRVGKRVRRQPARQLSDRDGGSWPAHALVPHTRIRPRAAGTLRGASRNCSAVNECLGSLHPLVLPVPEGELLGSGTRYPAQQDHEPTPGAISRSAHRRLVQLHEPGRHRHRLHRPTADFVATSRPSAQASSGITIGPSLAGRSMITDVTKTAARRGFGWIGRNHSQPRVLATSSQSLKASAKTWGWRLRVR